MKRLPFAPGSAMKKNRTAAGVLLGMFALLLAVSADAQVSGGGLGLDRYGNVPRPALGYAAPKYVPVCSGGYWPGEGGASTASQQTSFRRVFYCPRGAQAISLLLTNNFTTSGAAESDGTSALAINLGIETSVPAPWNSTVSYAVGQSVSYGRQNWTAAAGNTNSTPYSGNSNWTAVANATPVAVSCAGSRPCIVPLTTNGTGSPISRALIETDLIPVNIAAGSWIAIDGWTNQVPNAGTYQSSHTVDILKGETWKAFSSFSDTSLTGTYTNGTSPLTYGWSPVSLSGIPLTSGPTVCVLGDNISVGVVGNGVQNTTTLLSGGSGFVASDVGKVLTMGTSGASAGAVNTPATWQIGAITTGAVSTLYLASNGSYTNATSQPSQTLPSLAQTLTGPTTGSGVTVSGGSYGNPHDTGSPLNSQGPYQRGFDSGGVPWVAFGRSADQMAFWVGASGRDYSRLDAIQQSGCSSVIVALGVNDIGTGTSAATLEGYATALSAQLYGIGVKAIFYITISPNQTTSTDGFLTLANQTVNANNTQRNTYNTWVKTTPAGVMNGFIDMAAATESSPGSGLFIVDGATVCLMTCDGINPSATSEPIWAAPVLSFATSGALQ